MQRVTVMYNLKPGVSMKEYKKFSVEMDQKVVSNQPGVHKIEVFEIIGGDGDVPCQIVEAIDVDNWEIWQEILKGDAMKPVIKEWAKYGDGPSTIAVYGNIIK